MKPLRFIFPYLKDSFTRVKAPFPWALHMCTYVLFAPPMPNPAIHKSFLIKWDESHVFLLFNFLRFPYIYRINSMSSEHEPELEKSRHSCHGLPSETCYSAHVLVCSQNNGSGVENYRTTLESMMSVAIEALDQNLLILEYKWIGLEALEVVTSQCELKTRSLNTKKPRFFTRWLCFSSTLYDGNGFPVLERAGGRGWDHWSNISLAHYNSFGNLVPAGSNLIQTNFDSWTVRATCLRCVLALVARQTYVKKASLPFVLKWKVCGHLANCVARLSTMLRATSSRS